MQLRFLPLILIAFLAFQGKSLAVSPVLFGPEIAGPDKLVFPNGDDQPDVSFITSKGTVDISVREAGQSRFPGVCIQPAAPWDVSSSGIIEATVTNTSAKAIEIFLRVDDAAGETATASATIPPGETYTVPVYLDHTGKNKLRSSAIKSAIVFGTQTPTAQTFRLDKLVATGAPGETPHADPKAAAVKPANGVLLGTGSALPTAEQVTSIGTGKSAVDGGNLVVTFTGGQGEGITFKPTIGLWNLNEYFQLRVRIKNTGTTSITPSVRIDSRDGSTAVTPAVSPIAPGAETDILVPFAANTPWEGRNDPDMAVVENKGNFKGKHGTGTDFISHRVAGVTVLGGQSPGTLTVTAITAENPTAVDLPAWLGQRPPVGGEWSKTFEDNFDGASVDLTKWNIYGPNHWDKRTHFSKDNAIVKDGTLTLRVERKTGRHNDSADGQETDYATGFADTYGKWVQRYGYFEARVKLPTAPHLWPAFWLMPDRGLGSGHGVRQSTKLGGMEFDIIEQLSTWGSQRINFAMHWDGYTEEHKITGSGNVYVPADQDGFIVVGLLWTPGSAVLYGNGREVARWENPRISDVPSHIILDHVTGGWETEPIDDAKLPGDFILDYIRVWQRSDLASSVDGAKPNKATPAAPTE